MRWRKDEGLIGGGVEKFCEGKKTPVAGHVTNL